MGFFDNVIKKGINSGISNGISNGISSVLEGKVGEKLTEAMTPLSDAVSRMAENATVLADAQDEAIRTVQKDTVQERGECLVDGNVEANFLEVLRTEFADCELRQNVSPMEIGGSSAARNYTFGLYQGGAPRVLIMLTPRNRYQNRPFRDAKSACENNGIWFLNFFTHFSNEKSYVVNRIRTALNS